MTKLLHLKTSLSIFQVFILSPIFHFLLDRGMSKWERLKVTKLFSTKCSFREAKKRKELISVFFSVPERVRAVFSGAQVTFAINLTRA